MQFLIQPCIGWDEWNHPLLNGYKSCILFGPNRSSFSKHPPSSALESLSSLTTPQTSQSLSASARLPSKPFWKGPQIKTNAHKPINEQLCRRWNANTCNNDTCPQIHNLCNRVGCDHPTKRLSNPPEFLHQKFLRGFELSSPLYFPPFPSASLSLFRDPLPSPPPLSSDPISAYTLDHNPSSIAVVSPIHIPCFVALPKSHPNQMFVSSVICGFSHGFRPMASLPSTSVVNHSNHPSCSHHLPAITASRDKEVSASRYSQPFSTLLPGMKVSPLCVSFKKGSSQPRFWTDMSFGYPSPNALIDKSLVYIPLDSLKIFVLYLINCSINSNHIILRKSDVKGAYRLLLMYPQWQIRQIVHNQISSM